GLPNRKIGWPEAQQRRDQGQEHGGGHGGSDEAEGCEDPPFSWLPGRDASPLRRRRGPGDHGNRRSRSRDYDEGRRWPECSADGAPIRGVGIGGKSWAGSRKARKERRDRGEGCDRPAAHRRRGSSSKHVREWHRLGWTDPRAVPEVRRKPGL